ncbi:MAG TPA: dihydroorotate dehydrogenase-like protein [Terriglobales bacterium]|nr:dihydroorotate dehydrogenase-like protein [Terriglobales bacterium]
MIDLSTSYLGLQLKNPVVVSSSPLQRELDNIRRMEDAGAAAVVMHSMFEEQINVESEELNRWLENATESFAESLHYLPDLEHYNHGPDFYLEHLACVKKSVRIPVIASLNGSSMGGWTRYAKMMQEAGADAIELNTYYLATDATVPGSQVEEMYIDLVKQVKASVRIPLAIKVTHFFSSIPNMMRQLDDAGADGLVLFNRFYQPDIDLEQLEVVPQLVLSRSYELLLRLNWVAIVYGSVRADLAITGGVHTAGDLLKGMMVGARVTMMTSALLENGIDHIRGVLTDVTRWMQDHEYDSIRQMQGSMSRRAVPDPSAFERANYMRVLSSYALKKTGR